MAIDHLRGDAATLYDNDGIRPAWERAKPLLTTHPPDIAQLHVFPGVDVRKLADEIRAALPGVRLWLGIGCDGPMRRFRDGGITRAQLVAAIAATAGMARAIGAECLVLDPEDRYKGKTRAERDEDDAIAREIVDHTAAALGPDVVLGHTAYDHPTYHEEYAWRGFVGPGTPVRLELPQCYAAPGGDVIPHAGMLPTREAHSLASYRVAVREGLVAPDVEGPDTADDLDVRPYLQLHHVVAQDTIACALRYDQVCYWAVPSRIDADGTAAWKAIRKLRGLGFVGPLAVAGFQRAAGLDPDGVCGPKTLAALGAA